MKAAQFLKYGGPEVLEIKDNLPTPSPKEGQILVENYYASINPFDWKLRSGFMEKAIPLSLPVTIGGDFAGIVKEIGPGVQAFKVGDQVYGQAGVVAGGSGTFADLVIAKIQNSAIRPDNLSLEESGAIPLVGASSVQALVDHIGLSAGQKILIHGGAGGIGHIAVQLAVLLGAEVTATSGKDSMDFVKSLGAKQVIDYKNEKFEDILKDFDAVFDTVGGEVSERSLKVLKKGGSLVSMMGQPSEDIAKKYDVKIVAQFTQTTTERLNRLTGFLRSGKIKVSIDKVFSLDQTSEAFAYQETQHPKGKVVIKTR